MAASQGSSISDTSEEGFSISRNDANEDNNNKKVLKMKEKEVEEGSNGSSSHNVLDFVILSKDDSVRESKVQELDFFNPAKNNNDNNNEGRDENIEEKASESKSFSCNFCKRRFSTSQALGGHQNAHKPERALAKRRQELYHNGTLCHPNFPYYSTSYASLSTNPYYGSSYNNPLSIRRDSMIHKPPPPPGFRVGQGSAWSSMQDMLNITPLGKLRMDGGLNPNSGNGVLGKGGLNQNTGIGILGNGGASSAPLKKEDDGSRTVSTIHQFGGSLLADAATRRNTILQESTTLGTMDEYRQPKIEEPSNSDPSGLDLSLKL